MKLVSLKMQRSRRSPKLDKTSHSNHESLAKPNAASHEIHSYEELRQQIHDDLRVQHPEWVEPDGESPMCDSYERRLMDLLDSLTRGKSAQSIVDPHRLLEQGAN